MVERSGNGWHGAITGRAPVQGWGRVDGHPWYFRARGDAWSFEIADDLELDEAVLPVVDDENAGWLVEEDWGTWPKASYMDPDIAWSIVEACIARFRSGQLPYHMPSGSGPTTP